MMNERELGERLPDMVLAQPQPPTDVQSVFRSFLLTRLSAENKTFLAFHIQEARHSSSPKGGVYGLTKGWSR